MQKYDVAVIGGGASGLMAAWRAAKKGCSAAIIEGNPRVGKKLLATGNGRCNLTNLNISPQRYHGDVEKAVPLLAAYPAERVLAAFEELGLICREDSEGRMYPNSLQAAAVLQALRTGCEEAGVETICDFQTVEITFKKGEFCLKNAENHTILASKLILSAGGAASPKHSCRAGGYELAKSLGHSVTELSPSLVQLESKSKLLRPLKGMRCKAAASLWCNGKVVYEEGGEVLFGEKGLSGICIFNLSARLRKLSKGSIEVRLDLLESMTEEGLIAYLNKLKKEHPGRPCKELFSGILNLRVGQEIVKSLGIQGEKPMGELGEKELIKAAKTAKSLAFSITGPGAWENAQVTAGGVPLSEIDISTMESQKQPGLYLTGELLNIDGDCGGYNLHWAWATGMAAGEAAGK